MYTLYINSRKLSGLYRDESNSQYVYTCLYRTSVQGSTGFTPFFLMHFREIKLPIHLKVEQVTGEGAPELPSVTELRDSTMALIKLQEDYRAKAMQNIVRAQERQKKQYDRKHNTNTTLNVGDKVLKENSRNKHRMGGKLVDWTIHHS